MNEASHPLASLKNKRTGCFSQPKKNTGNHFQFGTPSPVSKTKEQVISPNQKKTGNHFQFAKVKGMFHQLSKEHLFFLLEINSKSQ